MFLGEVNLNPFSLKARSLSLSRRAVSLPESISQPFVAGGVDSYQLFDDRSTLSFGQAKQNHSKIALHVLRRRSTGFRFRVPVMALRNLAKFDVNRT